jgi:hypothetical protein
MPDEPVRLRPIEEADLDILRRFDTDPSARGPHLSSGFHSPRARRCRWEEDGWLGDDSAQLVVVLPDGTLAGIVGWRSIKTGGPEVGCLEIGALLFPEHRGQGLGPRRNDCWWSTCLRPRWPTDSRPSPMSRTSPSRKRWSVSGSAAKASCMAWPLTVDDGTTACCTPGFDTTLYECGRSVTQHRTAPLTERHHLRGRGIARRLAADPW